MANWKYYTFTIILYVVCIFGAIFVKNVSIIFNFVGAFGLSITSFAFPGFLYIMIHRGNGFLPNIESE